MRDRYLGSLLGLAAGDALGTTVEFRTRGSFVPLTDMTGGGPFQLKPGQWTDDTSMALCLTESLITKGGFDATDQMCRYLNWWQWGYLSSTGSCFDIGMTVRDALERLAPVVLFYHDKLEDVLRHAASSSRTTHVAPEAVESCQLFAELISRVLHGVLKDSLFLDLHFKPTEHWREMLSMREDIEEMAVRLYRRVE